MTVDYLQSFKVPYLQDKSEVLGQTLKKKHLQKTAFK